MLKTRKSEVLLPSISEGAAIPSKESKSSMDKLLDDVETRYEIDEESEKFQQIHEDAHELNLLRPK